MPERVLRVLRWVWMLPLPVAMVLDLDTAAAASTVTAPAQGTRQYLLVLWLVATITTCWTVQRILHTSRRYFDPAVPGLESRVVGWTLGTITVAVVVPTVVEGHAITSVMLLWSGLVLTGVLVARAHTSSDLVLAGIAAVLTVAPMFAGGDTMDEVLISMAVVALVIAITLGLQVREQHRRVAVARGAAVQEERMAMARELHDSVAHELTGILVLARASLSRDDVAGRTGEVFELISESSQRALDEIRSLVTTIDPQASGVGAAATVRTRGEEHSSAGRSSTGHSGSGLDRMTTMLDAFRASTTADVRVDVTDVGLTPSEWLTVQRVCAEALTNIRRHAADATHVTIDLTRDDTTVRLVVADDGRPDGGTGTSTGIGGGSGTGVAGARRRIEGLGGTLTAGRHDDGWWRLTAEFPKVTRTNTTSPSHRATESPA